MTPATWIGAAVSITLLLAFVARIFWSIHKGLDRFERVEGKVDALTQTLSNGIRSDIRKAAEQATEARFLAGKAATAAAVAQQRAEEGRVELQRAVNALRAEVNAMTNVAITDHENIWQTLAEAGLDRRRDDG